MEQFVEVSVRRPVDFLPSLMERSKIVLPCTADPEEQYGQFSLER
jgi:hypothetical protein